MRGFPKHLNSRADYEYIRQNFPIEKWKPEWDALLDNLQEWYCTGELNSVDAGATDDTHRVVTIAGQGGGECGKIIRDCMPRVRAGFT